MMQTIWLWVDAWPTWPLAWTAALALFVTVALEWHEEIPAGEDE